MCGIAGYYSPESITNCKSILSMVRLIAHRGPDDEGISLIDTENSNYLNCCSEFSHPAIQKEFHKIENSTNFPHSLALGHRRYSIIDLSADGHQPMIRNGIFLIFNGEIYNYIEIRKELESTFNYTFKTHTDTEIIIAAYEAWKENCFGRLNGFFSIVLYDTNNKNLIFARDRIGKSPLYYTIVNNSIYWSSEIKSLLAIIPELKLKINPKAVSDYLLYGIRDYDNQTFWAPVTTFPAASYCIINLQDQLPINKLEIKQYWQFPDKRMSVKDISLEEATTGLMDRLTQAIAVRMRSDIPVAFTLSGGLDSSTLAALYANNYKTPTDFLSVKYDNPRFDESGFASQVASTNPSIIRLKFINGMQNHLINEIDTYTYLIEEPYHSPVLYTDFHLQRILKERGYGVMLNGAGGDELLAGYEAEYFPDFIKYLSSESITSTITELAHVKNARMAKWAVKAVLELAGINIRRRKLPTYLKPAFHMKVLPKPADFNSIMLENFSSRKMNYWMRSGNKSYMGVPMEPRMPFLDFNVIDWAFILPPQYLIHNGWHKYILRKGIEKYLPQEVVWRKNKMGFPFDHSLWLSEQKEILCNNIANVTQQYIDLERLITDYDQMAKMYPDILWRYISFLLWYKKLICNEPIMV